MTQIAEKVLTTQEVVARFTELAQQEKWFDIQDELFADNVRSIEPAGSPYMEDAFGKTAVRKKADDFVGRIEAVHRVYTSVPIVTGNHIAVARETDITVRPHGRIQMNEIMLYEVKDGKIILEQFFY
ncbi:SnoaL-like domain-containing protein [Chitinophaga sp. 22536]|uniref:SnoaL-like domain-containing protein n=1 Tax=unclassified Chitinophaga TaxID=2619133 RepID=UPI003F876DA2